MIVALMPFGVGRRGLPARVRAARLVVHADVRFSVNNLAGVPSIVFGLFGLGFFIQFVGRGMDRAMGLDVVWGQPSLMWAALTLALLTCRW
jgi:phosphate transport system permease protein